MFRAHREIHRPLITLLMLLLVCTGCREEILHGLDELRANQALVVLAASGVEATKVADGPKWNIAVPKELITRALASLEESRILKRDLERKVEDSSAIIQSPEERAQALERDRAWDLEQTLERLPGVLEARVHLYLRGRERGEFSPKLERQSASVLLITSSAENDSAIVLQVKDLIAGGAGITADQVMVLKLSGDEPIQEPNKDKIIAHTVEESQEKPEHAIRDRGVPTGISVDTKWTQLILLCGVGLILFSALLLRSRDRQLFSFSWSRDTASKQRAVRPLLRPAVDEPILMPKEVMVNGVDSSIREVF